MRTLTLVASMLLFWYGVPAVAEVSINWKWNVGWKTGCREGNSTCYLTVPIDIRQRPASVIDAIYDCTNSDDCRSALADAAEAMEVPRAVIVYYLNLYRNAYEIFEDRHEGAAHWIYFQAPPGYKVCALYWSVRQNGGAKMSGTINDNRRKVVFYAVTPQRKWLEGGTSVEALVQVTMVKSRFFPPSSGCESKIYYEPKVPGNVVFDTSRGRLNGGRYACHRRVGSCAGIEP